MWFCYLLLTFAIASIEVRAVVANCCTNKPSNGTAALCANDWVTRSQVHSVNRLFMFGQNVNIIALKHLNVIKGGPHLPINLISPNNNCGLKLKPGQTYLLTGQRGHNIPGTEIYATRCSQYNQLQSPLLSKIPPKTLSSLKFSPVVSQGGWNFNVADIFTAKPPTLDDFVKDYNEFVKRFNKNIQPEELPNHFNEFVKKVGDMPSDFFNALTLLPTALAHARILP
ncbi:unnamed protein product, partial [Mesorhabditis belari]|uniref:Uncharacterized protein n=1 Tax=Mesorhabditis belari TaxID=2138241 RepID=A0AAF3F4Y5_9BILA